VTGGTFDNVDLFFFNESDALNFASNSIESIPPHIKTTNLCEMNSLANIKDNAQLIGEASGFQLPVLISNAGTSAEKRFVEFFTANIRNANTRKAYLRSINQFMVW